MLLFWINEQNVKKIEIISNICSSACALTNTQNIFCPTFLYTQRSQATHKINFENIEITLAFSESIVGSMTTDTFILNKWTKCQKYWNYFQYLSPACALTNTQIIFCPTFVQSEIISWIKHSFWNNSDHFGIFWGHSRLYDEWYFYFE